MAAHQGVVMKEIESFHIANQEQVIARVEELGKRSDEIKSRLALILKNYGKLNENSWWSII